MKELIYKFTINGAAASVKDADVVSCFPSMRGDGSYYFHLIDGSRFRGQNVREVIETKLTPLINVER